MIEYQLHKPIILIFLSMLLWVAAVYLKSWHEGIRLLMILIGILLAITGAYLAVDAIRYREARIHKERELARVYPQATLAQALKGLSPLQTEHVISQATIEISGLDNPRGVIVWMIKAPGGDLPLLLLEDLFDASESYYPHLFPIWEHSRFYESYGWKNAEELLSQATRFLIYNGYAEKAAGNRSAKLLFSLDWMREHFRI